MKRVITLDILRGIAIFVLVLTHTFIKCVDFSVLDTSQSSIFLFIAIAPLILLGKWKGFFLMISAAAHIFTLDRELKGKRPLPLIILIQLINCIMLIGVAYLFKIILLPNTTLMNWVFTGVWNPAQFIGVIQFSDTLELITISRFVNTFVYLLITRRNGINRPYRNMIILGILAILVIFITPAIVKVVTLYTGYTPDNMRYPIAETGKEMVKRMFLALLVGQQDPMFPFLSSAFVGGILGILFNQENISKRKTLRIGYSFCIFLVVLGVLLLPLSKDLIADVWNQIHAPWMLMINFGLQLACVFFLMNIIEFNPNIAVHMRRLRYFQRLGLISLTIYIYEFLDYIPRWLFSKVFNIDLVHGTTPNMLLLLLLCVFVLLFWSGLIRLWEFLRFYGTLEVFIRIVNTILQGQKFNPKDPMKIRETLYEVEPVYFHESPTTISQLSDSDSTSHFSHDSKNV